MIRNLIVNINSDRSVFPKELKVANRYEIKTNVLNIKFSFDLPENSFVYLVLTRNQIQYYYPLINNSFSFGSNETWINGGWIGYVLISKAEIIDGVVNSSEALFISDAFGLTVGDSEFNIEKLEEQELPAQLHLLYDDLLQLKSDLEELIKNGDFSDLAITIDSALSETSENPVQNKVITKEIDKLKESIANGGISFEEPMDDDIPKVFINGTIPTTKNEVLATLTYISKTEKFDSYITIKCQGDSSLVYPKKNFTVKMFSDEARETKLKKEFKGWGSHNKFVLKANYVDHSHARNIISSKLWGECVATREDYTSLPKGLKESPNNGAIEGFPIKVYNNGTYQGIYTWNIPKDDWLYGIDEDDPNQFVLYGQKNTNGVYGENANNFRKLWDGVSQSDREWEVEVGTNSDIVKNALNNVISLCMNADDVTFKNTLKNYLDVQSALDYYIHCYTICALDSLAQNMILVSYDGAKLYCSYYDGDSTFGLWWNGSKFVSATFKCPEEYQERYSLLWERIEKLFTDELKARYFELRKTVYSFSNMVTQFERFMDSIGSELYAEDLTIYSSIPSGSTNNIKQIRDYIRDRLIYCDEEFVNLSVNPDEPDTPEPDEPTIYTITNTLTNVTTDNSATSVEKNNSYIATIVANEDYTLSSVTVTMGGVDVTDSVYNNGLISIPNVNGNIVIVAVAYNNNMTVSMIPTSLNLSGFSNNTETGYCSVGGTLNNKSNIALNLVTVENAILTYDNNVFAENTTDNVVCCYYESGYVAFKVKQELLSEPSLNGIINYLKENRVKIVWAFNEEPIDIIPVSGYSVSKFNEGFEVIINDKNYNSTDNSIVSEIGVQHSIIEWQGNRYFKFRNYNDTLEHIQSIKDELHVYVFNV